MNNNGFAGMRCDNEVIAVAREGFDIRSIEVELNQTRSGQINVAATQLRGDRAAFRRYRDIIHVMYIPLRLLIFIKMPGTL